MTAGGKGHARRPTDEAAYSAGYDAIFGRKADQALADGMRAENLARANPIKAVGPLADVEVFAKLMRDEPCPLYAHALREAAGSVYHQAQMGRSSTAEQAPLTRSVVGSNPTAPAIRHEWKVDHVDGPGLPIQYRGPDIYTVYEGRDTEPSAIYIDDDSG